MINISRLLFPSHIGKFRLFSQRSLGIQLGESFVRASIVNHKQNNSIIEKILEINLDSTTALISAEGVIDEAALTKVLGQIYKQAGNVDRITISIPANFCVFKELVVPFCQDEKINMMLKFEAEPLLPFPIDRAALSYIKKPNATNGQCLINICATQQSLLQAIKQASIKLNIKPDAITVDLVALADLCNQLESWTGKSQSYAIVMTSEFWTKIGIIDNGLLHLVKTIPNGTFHLAQNISKKLDISIEDAAKIMQKPLDGIIEQELIVKSLQQEYTVFCKKIVYALQSFMSKLDTPVGLDKIIFLEEKVATPELVKICQQQLDIPCQLFSAEKLLAPNKIINRASFQASAIYNGAIALACALTSDELTDFDLGKPEISKSFTDKLQQLFAASIVLVGLLFGYLFISNYFKSNQLNELITSNEKIIKDQLIQKILIGQKFPRNIATAKLLDEATKTVNEMKLSWQKHGNDDLKPLETLLDLTRIIDRTKINLKITAIKMFYDQNAKKAIDIKGSFEAADGDKELQKLVTSISSLKKFGNIETKIEKSSKESLFQIQAILEF